MVKITKLPTRNTDAHKCYNRGKERGRKAEDRKQRESVMLSSVNL